jgi:hypothetical protein
MNSTLGVFASSREANFFFFSRKDAKKEGDFL